MEISLLRAIAMDPDSAVKDAELDPGGYQRMIEMCELRNVLYYVDSGFIEHNPILGFFASGQKVVDYDRRQRYLLKERERSSIRAKPSRAYTVVFRRYFLR